MASPTRRKLRKLHRLQQAGLVEDKGLLDEVEDVVEKVVDIVEDVIEDVSDAVEAVVEDVVEVVAPSKKRKSSKKKKAND
jgi:hypothetical protein